MDLTLSDEQQTLSESARALLDQKAPADRVSEVAESDAGYDEALTAQMTDLGWASLGLVRDSGTLLEFALIGTQLGAHATPTPVAASVMAGATVRRLGSGAVADEAAEAIAEGRLAALVADDQITAERCGGQWRISGRVSAVEWAPSARLLVVVASSQQGRVMLLVDPEAEGVTIDRQQATDATRLGTVALTDVVAEPPLGFIDAAEWREHLHLLRVLRAADMLGSAQAACEMTREHVIQREQFGRPLAMFQAVQHHLANTAMETEASEYLIREALWRFAAGLPFERYAAMAAWHTADAAVRATQVANQLHGGIGFMKEFHLHHYFHRVIAQRGRMGTEQHRVRDLGDVVVEAAERGYHDEFAEWPVAAEEDVVSDVA